MSEQHNNTYPAKSGNYAISKYGLISYFPVEKADGVHPFMALILREYEQIVDGVPVLMISAAIDTRYESIRHESE